MYVNSSFTVANLHDLWSNYPRSIWHVIGPVQCMKIGGNLGKLKAEILGAMAHMPLP